MNGYMNESCPIWASRVYVTWVTQVMHRWCRLGYSTSIFKSKKVFIFQVIKSDVACEWVMSHENESCHMRMSHVTYEWVMSHVKESCYMGMGHVTCERMMSHMNESCHVWMSHVTYEWVMSYVNESCHESCHIWMGHVTGSCVNESCHIKLCHMWMSHVTESCHIWMSHITRLFHKCYSVMSYGVATISRLLKIISLFCRIWSLL